MAIFRRPGDKRFMLDCLSDAANAHAVSVHAYVLMTNHVHLLVTSGGVASVAAMMQAIGRRYVARFNFIHGRTGTLFEGRYRSALVDADAYLLACMRYIELNPVRAGIVTDPGAFRWSSYSANAWGAADPVVEPHSTYLGLAWNDSARRKAYRAFVASEPAPDMMDRIRTATRRGTSVGLGSESNAAGIRLRPHGK